LNPTIFSKSIGTQDNTPMKPTIKQNRSIIWKALLGLAGVAVIIVAVLAYIAWRNRQNIKVVDKQLSESVIAYRFYNHNCGLKIYNADTGHYTLEGIKWVRKNSDKDSLAVFCRDGLRGYLNVNTGKPAIPEQYSHAWNFSEDVAAVVKDGKIGFINSRGETVIPFGYCYADRDGYPMDYVFHDGYCVMTADADGTCGLIDRSGQWVVEPEYDYVYPQENGTKCRLVKKDGKYGLLDENLLFIFPVEYDAISISDKGGVNLTKGGYKWRADYDGKVLDPFIFDGLEPIYNPSGNDPVKDESSGDYENTVTEKISDTFAIYKIGSKCGVIRKDNGKVVIPAIYDSVTMISPTLFDAQEDSRSHVLFDINGKVVTNGPRQNP
jgi:hypothetical protein